MGKLHTWLFSRVHGGKLIYNTCWEDPRCDRKLMQFDEQSEIVMITSAGDNALDYLLDNPAKIHTIDMNYRQNALLDLKRAMYRHADYQLLFDFFGEGNFEKAKRIYYLTLRKELPESSQKYWDKHIKYFNQKGVRKSFYYRGTSGALAFFCKSYIRLKCSARKFSKLMMSATTLEEQVQFYNKLERKLFNPLVKFILNRHFTMVLAGVPKSQQNLMKEAYGGSQVDYIKESFRNIFTKLDVKENYFYQVYLNGKYTTDSCPEYLKESNFSILNKRQDRISSYTTTVSEFLKEHPGNYSHYVLLDHQDWLAANDVPALEEEWELILKNSQPGTKILLRSAASEIQFFPKFVLEKVKFDFERTKVIHKEDRVGTYASVYLGIVK